MIVPAADEHPGCFLGLLEEVGEGGPTPGTPLVCSEHGHRPALVIRSVSADEAELEIRACCARIRQCVEAMLADEHPV